MSFNSFDFLIFLGLGMIFYYISPQKCKSIVLLLISYAFYGSYNWKVLLFLIGFSVVIYLYGRCLETKKKKIFLYGAVFTALLPLLLCKYSRWNLVLPLGISYFTFKSIGYLADIYKGKIKAEKNIILVCSFIAFFPEMLIGPIDRAENLLPQLKNREVRADWENIQKGIFILLGGYFEKMVIADRLGILVDHVYNGLYVYEGFIILVAVFGYSFQIYLDFAGCTHMALGVGRILGFSLPENFKQPYLAVSVADFWRRWHISLTSWLRDFIYIPLGGNRRGMIRKYVNIMIVFLISGVWHGTGICFLIWGGLNGIFQIVGACTNKVRKNCYTLLHIRDTSMVCIWWKRIWTFLWMSFAWIFFRMPSISDAILVLKKAVSKWNPWTLFDGSLFNLGLSQTNMYLLLILLMVMLLIDLLHEQGVSFSSWMTKCSFPVKCVLSYGIIFAIIILGIYGDAYDAGSFIYMQF